jgi:three-Cys-motif partner protein
VWVSEKGIGESSLTQEDNSKKRAAMAKPTGTLWGIESHTLAKHEILRRYLGAWFPILAKYNGRIVYLNGFCGPGRYKGGEDGSPIIALREALSHSMRLQNNKVTFLFIDERADRIEHLRAELSSWTIPSNFQILPLTGLFENELRKLLDELEIRSQRLAPTFGFIDPFGYKGLPFELVGRLLNNPKTEVFITIMIDFINRFLEHPDLQTKQHIIDLFGTPLVLDIAQQPGDRVTALRMLYQEQLKKYAKYVRYFEMRDDRNKTIYYLFFATNHRLGHVKMKEAFWRVDTSSGFSFSDRTNPDQLILFELDPSDDVAKDLLVRFGRRTVVVREVREYVEDETPYKASHMRGALSFLEEKGQIHVEVYKENGKKRMRGKYPDGAIVNFR